MSTDRAIQRLINLGFKPNIIFDVGAHEGSWTRDMRKLFPDSKYYLFEADTDKIPHLAGENAHFEVLYSCDNKPIEFYKTKFQFTTGNSVFKELSKHYTGDNYYIDRRISKTLSTVIKEKSLPIPNFLKLDTQGSELEILKGCSDILPFIDIVYLEASLHQYNANSPLIYDILDYMKHYNFVLCDMGDEHIIHGVNAQIDIFLCKKGSQYFKSSFL